MYTDYIYIYNIAQHIHSTEITCVMTGVGVGNLIRQQRDDIKIETEEAASLISTLEGRSWTFGQQLWIDQTDRK